LFPNGDIGVCGRSAIVYGNILKDTRADMWVCEKRKRLLARQKILDEYCGKCTIRRWCNGGCQALLQDTPTADFCEGFRGLLSFLATEGMDRLQQLVVAQRARVKEELHQLQSGRDALASTRASGKSGNV
jgi:radical SAM protein with 4Fe4S-binding SPASM domain